MGHLMLQPKHLSQAVSKIMANKRDSERVEAIFSAIIMEEGEFVCHCIIRDVSVTGMKLELTDGTKIPDFFELKTPAMPEVVTMKTAWRQGNNAGAEFYHPSEEPVEEAEAEEEAAEDEAQAPEEVVDDEAIQELEQGAA